MECGVERERRKLCNERELDAARGETLKQLMCYVGYDQLQCVPSCKILLCSKSEFLHEQLCIVLRSSRYGSMILFPLNHSTSTTGRIQSHSHCMPILVILGTQSTSRNCTPYDVPMVRKRTRVLRIVMIPCSPLSSMPQPHICILQASTSSFKCRVGVQFNLQGAGSAFDDVPDS